MVSKVLTIVPILILAGMFFAAGIAEAGILFVVFAVVMLFAFVRGRRGGPWPSPEEESEIEMRTSPVPGAPRRGIGGGRGT
jgi:hypothetical protein